jgi:membrane associated rhomboid family serine protease
MTIFTSMFLHGGLMHIGGNMLYLWIFGDNVEESMGRFKFVLFYALCGIAAALAQSAVDPASRIPMIGASGGIAGILGAYLMLHPKAAIRTFVLIIIFVRFINLPAWIVLSIWIGGQFVAVPNALASDGGGVAYFAHIGGFAAGMLLIPFFKRRDVPLFGRDDTQPQNWTGQRVSFSTIKAEAHNRYRSGRERDPLGSRRVNRPAPPAQNDSKTDEKPTKRVTRGSVPTVKRRPAEKRGPWG